MDGNAFIMQVEITDSSVLFCPDETRVGFLELGSVSHPNLGPQLLKSHIGLVLSY